jgi:hypothetical protein
MNLSSEIFGQIWINVAMRIIETIPITIVSSEKPEFTLNFDCHKHMTSHLLICSGFLIAFWLPHQLWRTYASAADWQVAAPRTRFIKYSIADGLE